MPNRSYNIGVEADFGQIFKSLLQYANHSWAMEKNPSLLKLQICRSKIQEFPLMDRAPVSSCFMLIAQVDSGNLHTTQVDCSKTQPP
jgi:hypothetical protein